MHTDIEKVLGFIIETDKLKAVLRKTRPAGLDRYENSAEHSWQICLLALLLSRHASQPVDGVRVVEMLLVHDIPEIYAGDQIVYQAQTPARAAEEAAAAVKIFGMLPEPQAAWCLSRWQEYEQRSTPEARYAYAIDRLMPLLLNLSNDGQSWRENGVPLQKILSINAVLGDELPEVWGLVEKRILDFAAAGGLDPSAH